MDALKPFWHRKAILVLWCSLLFSAASIADIALVVRERQPMAEQLAKTIAQGLKIPSQLLTLGDKQVDWSSFDAIVLLGEPVLEAWQTPTDSPVVAVFVSRESAQRRSALLKSAIYVEPPLSRQITLSKILLGFDVRLGVLVSDAFAASAADEVAKVQREEFVNIYPLSDLNNLNRTLIELLADNQALVGVYDSELYSPGNIKNILITAYRQNRPLIGPSSAYIKAGSLASTYSDLDDVSKRLIEILSAGLNNKQWAKQDYNPYFQVRYNEQVGRSLNLSLPNVNDAVKALMKAEENRHELP
ncbi:MULTISPECIES: hypothetical protein [Thalassolituus]|jgi:ABC-type uncharacterized transport system substrate-binding protein|uniref:ABC transporter substrate-binding protein n=1 Tax=Thalassolituus oleivorans MIL-1 TaxID=1298593 RepID=M5DNT2_9GAMM|nr:hypothetical protein [Thalassolituus oleivorans]CCU71103.1 hypothetical protein TOL_0665 [Thalassolituus oleivorans MIL-1]|tara:strand:+ start:3363 stop:4268 length:906 start_codon:yes stop_codon:yes gene_type:complete